MSAITITSIDIDAYNVVIIDGTVDRVISGLVYNDVPADLSGFRVLLRA